MYPNFLIRNPFAMTLWGCWYCLLGSVSSIWMAPHAFGQQDDVVLTIRVRTPQPISKDEDIFLTGNIASLGPWSPNALKLVRVDNESFQGIVRCQPHTELEMKITRGSWNTVEKTSQGAERPNRKVVADQNKEVQIDVEAWADRVRDRGQQSTVVGNLEIHQVSSIQPARRIRVWLPDGYQSKPSSETGSGSPAERFGVLYVLDGQNAFDRGTAAFGEEWGIDEAIHERARLGKKQVIVVAIDNSPSRFEEYTPFPSSMAGKARGGRSDAFLEWIVKTLKPQIDREYRTRPERDFTWICGSSLGGLCALDAVLRYNDVFGGAIAMSPSVSWKDDKQNPIDWLKSEQSKLTRKTSIWIDFGSDEGRTSDQSKELLSQFDRLADSLRMDASKGTSLLRVSALVIEGGKHRESDWRARFPEAFRFLIDQDGLK